MLKGNFIDFFITEKVSSGCKVTDFDLEDINFVFRPGRPTFPTNGFRFPRSFYDNAELVFKLGHCRFRTCLLRFIIHQLFRHLTLHIPRYGRSR
jgi:hypothetical protein